MIAISSFRPFDKCNEQIKENQLRAFRSWLTAFDRIVYLNDREASLESCKTEFIVCEGKPKIKELSRLASTLGSWACIVNSDIVVTEKISQVEQKLNELECECAISQRYDLQTGRVIDNGLDFFAARPHIWARLSLRIPEGFTLGRIAWDSWTLGWMVANYGRKCADITPAKVCYHPRHEDRFDQNWNAPKDDKYLKTFFWPTMAVY